MDEREAGAAVGEAGGGWERAGWPAVGLVALLTSGAAVRIGHADPSRGGALLWLGSMVAATIAGVLQDRATWSWRSMVRAVGWRPLDSLAVVALTAAAFALRVHRLGPSLPFMHGDEGEMGVLARLALHGPAPGAVPLPVFGTGFLDHPTLFHYLQAGALATFGDSITSLELLSTMFGALSAPAVFVVGRLGWGRAAGMIGGWLLVVSHVHIHYSRVALNNIQSAWFVVVAFAIVTTIVAIARPSTDEAPRAPPITLFVLLGLTVGISQYFYFGSRVLVVTTVVFLVVLVPPGILRWRDAVAVLGGAFVAGLPLLRHYLAHADLFMARARGVSVFNELGIRHALGPDARWPDDAPRLLRTQLGRNLDFFLGAGDSSAFYTPNFPAFDRLTLLLFWVGVLVVGARALRRHETTVAARLVLAWIVPGVVLGGVLTNDAPNGPRLLMVVPAVFVIGGVGAQALGRLVVRRRPMSGPRLVRAAAAGLVVVTGFTNWNRYFVEYANDQPLRWITEMAVLIDERTPTHHVYLLGDGSISVNHGVVRFLAGGDEADVRSVEEFESRYSAAGRDGRGTLVIALPALTVELDRIQQVHPGGVRDVTTDRYDRALFATYELPVP